MLAGLFLLLIAVVFAQEATEKVEGAVIGIDLGTTYSMFVETSKKLLLIFRLCWYF
jgi:hypothetical protein